MSILDQWQDRWNFAVYNNEQRFQTELVTKRRFFRAVVSLPLNRIQNKILRPDVPTSGFDAAAFRFVEDVFIGAGAGQLVRSFAFAYQNNKEFRDVHNASRVLEGLGMAVEAHDDAPQTLAEEIAAGRSGAMHDLVTHSGEASHMLEKFVHGELDITPTNVAALERHLHAIAHVCDEKSEMMQQMGKLRNVPADENSKPADYIRDVMRADGIKTAREAQILSGFVSAVLVEAAAPLGTEIYVPREEEYMSPDAAVKFAAFVENQLDSRGMVPNVGLEKGEQRPFPDLPEGAMIKAVKDASGTVVGHEKITKRESLAFANSMHQQIKQELGPNLEAMLSYVDAHFDRVENAIARSKEDPTPLAYAAWPNDGKEKPEPKKHLENPDKWQEKGFAPFAMLSSAQRVLTTGARHLMRPEATHENKKLFGRAIAGQLVAYPVRIIDEALKSFLRPGKGYDMMKEATKTGEAHGELIDMQDLKQNLDSNTFKLLTSPLAASFGTVYSQELYHLPKGLAIEAAGRAGKVLNGAIRAGHKHAPQVGERMAKAGQTHPAVEAILRKPEYQGALQRVNATPPEKRSAKDYELLADYYRDLGNVCVSVAEEALSPFGVGVKPDKIEPMGDVVARVLRRRVDNVPDAMIAMAYVQNFLNVSAEKTSMMEYVDPREVLIKHRHMHKLGNFVDDQAKAAGLVPAKGDELPGIERGTLLQKGKGGKWQEADGETLVRFANVVTNELKNFVDLDALLAATRGKLKEEYVDPLEDALFSNSHFAVAGADKTVTEKQAPKELTESWQGRVKRKGKGVMENIRENLAHPEVKHEIRKLMGRSKGEAVSAFLPGIIYNSLQHDVPIRDRTGLASALYKTMVYPFVFSYGLVSGKESINEVFLRRRHIMNESDIAKGLMEAAITTAGTVDGKLKETLTESNQINEAMLHLEERPEFRDVPRVSAKPRDERTPQDEALMERFCAEIGDVMLDQSARIFGALGEGYQGESIEAVMERTLERPVDNLKDATITIGLMHSIIDHNASHLDVLTFIDPDEVVLDRKQLRELTEYMNDQAKAAGFAIHGVPVKGSNGEEFTLLGKDESLKEGELMQWNEKTNDYERAPAESIIRYANLAAAKFRHLAQDRLKAEEAPGSLAERYQRETKTEIFTRL